MRLAVAEARPIRFATHSERLIVAADGNARAVLDAVRVSSKPWSARHAGWFEVAAGAPFAARAGPLRQTGANAVWEAARHGGSTAVAADAWVRARFDAKRVVDEARHARVAVLSCESAGAAVAAGPREAVDAVADALATGAVGHAESAIVAADGDVEAEVTTNTTDVGESGPTLVAVVALIPVST